jgi:hypothetical protein
MTEHDEPPAPPEPALLRAEITGLERFGGRPPIVEFRSDQQLWRTTTLPPNGGVLDCSFARESGEPVDHGAVELTWDARPAHEGDLTVSLSDPIFRKTWERVGPMGGHSVGGLWRLAFMFQAPKD